MTKLRLIATEEAFATPRQVEAFRRAADTLWHSRTWTRTGSTCTCCR